MYENVLIIQQLPCEVFDPISGKRASAVNIYSHRLGNQQIEARAHSLLRLLFKNSENAQCKSKEWYARRRLQVRKTRLGKLID